MNSWNALGRICNELELKQTPSGKSVLQFTLAVDRGITDGNGNKLTDFISCVAWEKTAQHIAKWFSKGRMILVEGSIQTRNYDNKDGQKVYVTEANIYRTYFTGEAKKEAESGNADDTPAFSPSEGFTAIDNTDDLPF